MRRVIKREGKRDSEREREKEMYPFLSLERCIPFLSLEWRHFVENE